MAKKEILFLGTTENVTSKQSYDTRAWPAHRDARVTRRVLVVEIDQRRLTARNGTKPVPAWDAEKRADCNPCPHGKLKRNCADCNPCPHGRLKRVCADCNPCPHGKLKSDCAACNPCPHGQLKGNCVKCSPCPHGKVKYKCAACKSARAERSVSPEIKLEPEIKQEPLTIRGYCGLGD